MERFISECCQIILPTFYYIKSRDYLELSNRLYLYSLYCYFPPINKSLEQISEYLEPSCHTAEYKSPHLLFTAGALKLQWSGIHGLDFFQVVDESYDVEEVGLPLEHPHFQNVSNSDLKFHLVKSDFHQPQQLVDHMQQSLNYGIGLYLMTLQFVADCVKS